MAICRALKSSNINLLEGRVISFLAYKMQNKGRDNSSLALKVLASLQLDESTDVSLCSQLLIFVRYVKENEVAENFCFVNH